MHLKLTTRKNRTGVSGRPRERQKKGAREGAPGEGKRLATNRSRHEDNALEKRGSTTIDENRTRAMSIGTMSSSTFWSNKDEGPI